jgi:tetratricopeptide (TPR) repeat protein
MLKTYGDTTEETGYKFGKETFKKNSVSLVYTCDAYYHLMDTIRYTALRNLNKEEIRKSIADMDSITVKNEDFYTKRGLFYFQLMEVANALNDFDEVLRLNENSFQIIYFKAWGLEIQKKYDEAIQLYNKVATITQKNEIAIMAAVANRKKMEP